MNTFEKCKDKEKNLSYNLIIRILGKLKNKLLSLISIIAQNDTSLPVTTFPWFHRMSTLPWWYFMKVTEKTPNLEDPYLDFCNSVWPHLCIVGKIFLLAKTFQKTPKSENSQKYTKNEFLICTSVFIYNSRVRLKYATFCIATRMYSSCTRLLFLQPTYTSWKCQKNMNFETWVVWVVMQLTPSIVTTLSSTLTLH